MQLSSDHHQLLLHFQNLINQVILAAKLKDRTREVYQEIYQRIEKDPADNLVEYAIEHVLRPNTFYQYKAAYQHGLALEIQKTIDQVYKTGDAGLLNKVIQFGQELETLCPRTIDTSKPPNVALWKKMAKEAGRQLYPKEEIEFQRKLLRERAKEKGEEIPKRRRTCKKNSVKGLPKDWQLVVLSNLDAQDKIPYAVAALTGCRPIELDRGTTFQLTLNGKLQITIPGAKYSMTQAKGQKYRYITFDPNKNLLAKALRNELLSKSKRKIRIKIHEKVGTRGRGRKKSGPMSEAERVKAFGDRVRYVTQKKVGLYGVSAYSVRHQASADFKVTLKTDKKVAIAMGHRSLIMQDQYSSGKDGHEADGLTLVNASQAKEIRGAESKQKQWHSLGKHHAKRQQKRAAKRKQKSQDHPLKY